MFVNSVVGFTSVSAAVAAVTAIAVIGYVFNDIDRFYHDALVELNEFKIEANTAWDKIIHSLHEQNQREVRSTNGHVLLKRRRKQSGSGSSCACAAQPNDCPPGPPGPS
ncbi:unnamed protein product, partial [Nippostrongylus brasiliensis]|uniref:Col_cuticle_N domain-containing protein n=1 Tax=Nippostrongylus brasiliensis TaxID=27835 RepID=A0A0N4XQ27_NIPBR